VSHSKEQPILRQGVVDGVVEIDVDIEFGGVDINSVRQDLIDAVEKETGERIEIYDHVLFCVPNGSINNGDDEWVAFAILGGQVSTDCPAFFLFCRAQLTPSCCTASTVQLTFYNDFCDRISIIMHEVGHNLR
jgi:hypothetical protein